MKRALLFFSLFISISLTGFSQVTYLVDTAFTTDIGYGGAPASCIYTGGNVDGWRMQRAVNEWISDVFTIPANTAWTFDTVIIYGHQKGSGTTSPFVSCNLQIYDGTPGLGGTVIWGDTTTNVLVSTGFTGIYRVDTVGGITNNTRPIFYLKLYLSSPPHLSSGTYWLSWSVEGSINATDAPPKVLPGRINPSGQTARQLFEGNWDYVEDNTRDIGFNKIIKASAAIASSVPGITNKTSATLNQNVPNPFNGKTSITFNTPQSGYAKLGVYNTVGQLVTTLVDGNINAGTHQVTFNVNALPPGIYYYQLNTDTNTETKQMVLVK